MTKILLVDDEEKLCKILYSLLSKRNYSVHLAHNGASARHIMNTTEIDIVLLDMMLPDVTGLELLSEFVGLYPSRSVIIMTAYGDIESAVQSMKVGAFDYIVKPAKFEHIYSTVEKAHNWLAIQKGTNLIGKQMKPTDMNDMLLSASPVMSKLFELVERVAHSDVTILLQGESGTGKSHLAKLIHRLSDRQFHSFVAINCAAIPEQLLESELFGFEKGTFTGAHESKSGKFEAANEGTIFLDEIAEMPLSVQAKLLHVTQEKTFTRLGSNKPRIVDVRIISATNRNLKQMVQNGKFREDLYYRLNILDIRIPALRERKEDIPLLVESFLEKHRQKSKKHFRISDQLMGVMMGYPWPGNVRELQNAVERAVVLCQNEELSIDDFPAEIKNTMIPAKLGTPALNLPDDKSLPNLMDETEKQLILHALAQSHGKAAEAAKKLGISRQNLLYKLNKYGIRH